MKLKFLLIQPRLQAVNELEIGTHVVSLLRSATRKQITRLTSTHESNVLFGFVRETAVLEVIKRFALTELLTVTTARRCVPNLWCKFGVLAAPALEIT